MPRTKGATDIPKRKKARILAKKNVQELTVIEIAAQEGVCRNSVIAIKPETVSADVLAMAQKYERDFILYAEANALKAQKRTFDTIGELSADKAAIVAEKNFNMSRLWRNQPTSIVQTQESKIEHYATLTRKIANELGITVEETFQVVIEDIPSEFVEGVRGRLLGDGNNQ